MIINKIKMKWNKTMLKMKYDDSDDASTLLSSNQQKSYSESMTEEGY